MIFGDSGVSEYRWIFSIHLLKLKRVAVIKFLQKKRVKIMKSTE